MSTTTQRSKWAVALMTASVGAMTLGGCKTVSQADYTAAIEENTELRERLSSLQETVRQSNSQTSQLQGQNQSLAAENDRLGLLMETERTRSTSGFEGIPGVSVSGSGNSIVVAIAGDVLFSSGSISLKTDAKRSLDRIAQVLESRYGGNQIRVEGYTDSDPIRKSKWKSNEHLSAERALSVEQYLVKKGVSNDRIYAAAFGPALKKGTKKDSRRVEIVILGA